MRLEIDAALSDESPNIRRVIRNEDSSEDQDEESRCVKEQARHRNDPGLSKATSISLWEPPFSCRKMRYSRSQQRYENQQAHKICRHGTSRTLPSLPEAAPAAFDSWVAPELGQGISDHFAATHPEPSAVAILMTIVQPYGRLYLQPLLDRRNQPYVRSVQSLSNDHFRLWRLKCDGR